MKEINVTMRNFSIGVCEEYNVRRIRFDISEYRRAFGAGTPVLLVTRPGESQSYPLNLEVEGDYAVWVPQQRDTDIPGTATLVLQWYVEDGLAISTEYYGRILGSKSEVGEVPEAEERWYRDVLQAGKDAISSAKSANAAAEQAETAARNITASADATAESEKAAENAAQRAETAAELTAKRAAELPPDLSDTVNGLAEDIYALQDALIGVSDLIGGDA